ncbi:spermidine/putrescine ABC transporter ATP-binding protein [Corynebacterium glutamicum]|nr:spermidine/putrescine ABC transporter ATP-binding protein [Corynebacterium glutamicum]AIK88013.1 spermidine/putrescine ABC transporter ATP-binding protein [Corynebacterium glutamicum]
MVKRFGTKEAVAGISFEVPRGQVLALLGPNGAGKTTTIEMCEGFTAPTSGSIRVLGIDPATEPDQVRRRIGIMLQGGGSYSGIRVFEMLKLAASYNDNPHDPEWLLDLVGLREQRKTTYRRLSGGQQQRLSLALALISRPEIIFLDEPTAGMDAQSRNMVWELVNDLRRDGVTIVLTTHLMDEAEALADHVIIVANGQILASGTPDELTAQRDHLEINVSVETTSPLDLDRLVDDLSSLNIGDVKARANRPLHYSLRTQQATPDSLAHIVQAVARQNVMIRSLDTGHRSLEDVFLDITGKELRS